MAKNKKIETHAKVEETEPTTLEMVWGYNELARYGTLDEAVYNTQLDDMNRSDLENHARRLGVIVVESSVRLKESLKKEFRVYVSQLKKPAAPKNTPLNIDEATKRILAEGR